MSDYDRLLTVGCPRCFAAPGQRCTTGHRAYGAEFVHISRRWAYERPEHYTVSEVIEQLTDADLGDRLHRLVRQPRPFPREVRNALVIEAARRLVTYDGVAPTTVLHPTAARAATNQGEQP